MFKQCPRFTTGVNLCFYLNAYGGKVTLNKQTVPIKNTITLQGGYTFNENRTRDVSRCAEWRNAVEDTAEVPGGLLGLVKCNEISKTN